MYYKIFLLLLLSVCSWSAQATPGQEDSFWQEVQLPEKSQDYSPPRLSSTMALVYDVRSERPLYQKNAETITSIASISKLMTAMVVLDADLPMNAKIRITREDMDRIKWTHSRMRPGMILTRRELLKLALMSSENRAAAALARTYPGGTVAAVKQMNLKARELGMHYTHFVEPTGLSSYNVSTAADLVKLVQAAQKYDAIHDATTTSSHVVRLAGYRPLHFSNTNPLVRSNAWDIDLSKTGYINEAGKCLVMKANIVDRPVIIVLLDSWGKNTRFTDASRVKQWIEQIR